MKRWMAMGLLAVAWGLSAEEVTLVNVTAERPVFNLVSHGVTLTRTLAPGNRVALEPGLFSGLGLKKVALAGGETYYLAKIGGSASLYRLATGQVLVLNQSGRAVNLTLDGQSSASALLASGSWALGALASSGLKVTWDGGGTQTVTLPTGGVFRLILDSPGIGTAVSLQRWDWD